MIAHPISAGGRSNERIHRHSLLSLSRSPAVTGTTGRGAARFQYPHLTNWTRVVSLGGPARFSEVFRWSVNKIRSGISRFCRLRRGGGRSQTTMGRGDETSHFFDHGLVAVIG